MGAPRQPLTKPMGMMFAERISGEVPKTRFSVRISYGSVEAMRFAGEERISDESRQRRQRRRKTTQMERFVEATIFGEAVVVVAMISNGRARRVML